ncbi:MAG: sulfatase-like hydrolase/transferase, partial [Planctomycetota bacterium]|nr:sulfatase-like hydrolase/transferase [Planctomycetota bacterium]
RIISNPKGIERAEALGRGKVIPCKRWERIRIQVDRTLDFIRRHREGPFYVRLFPNDVHDAHVPIPGTVAKYAELSERANVQNFLAVLAELDRQLGRVIDEIDELGLAEKTLIIFTSDNGPTDWPKIYTNGGRPAGFTGPFFGRKWSLFEGGIRMPFIARWEGTIPPGAQDDESVMSGIDISPTLCSFAGVEVEEDLDGVDRSRVLLGEPMPRGKPVFWQYGHPHAVLQGGKPEHQSPTFAMREGPWKLLVNPDGSEARLFHLVKDPGEKTNLLEENHARASEMALRVRRWAAEMGLYSPGYDGLRPPGPTMAISTGGQLLRFVNHGVAGESGRLQFDGKSWLDLPEFRVPKIAGGRQLQVKATVTSEADDGVILAHGDSREGYSVYLEGGKLAFATRVNGERRVLMTPEAVPQPFTFEANWKAQGEMFLKLGRKIVARGKSAGILAREPEERMQIGADLGRPVGSVGGLDEFGRTTLGIFQGSLENLTFRYPRGK